MKELKVTINKNEKINDKVYKLEFTSNFILKNSSPGQFVHILCSDNLDPLLRRPFSISDLDYETKSVTIYYAVVGKGTKALSKSKPGENLSIMGPLGKGFKLNNLEAKTLYIVGGGIGAAPLLFLSRKVSAVKTLKDKGVKLFLGAATAGELVLKQEFESKEISNIYPATEDGTLGYHGRVTELVEDQIEKNKQDNNRENEVMIFGCGPLPMLKSLKNLAIKNKFSCQLSLEVKMACGIGTCLGCTVHSVTRDNFLKVCKDGPVFWSQEVEI